MSEPVVAPATPPAPPPPPPTAADLIKADLPAIDLDALLAVEPAAPTPPPAAAPVSPAAVTPPTEPPAAPVPNPEDVTPPDPGERFPKFRYRPKDFREAEVMRLTHEGKTLPEAMKEVYGTTTPTAESPKAATPPTPPADPGAEYDTKITAAQGELTTLQAAVDKAAEEGDTKALKDAMLAFTRKEREIERLSDQKAAAVTAAQTSVSEQENETFRQKAGKASAQAFKEFPQFAVGADGVKSPERLGLEDYIASKREDPDYEAVFLSPRWPLLLAREYASDRGLKPAAGAPPPPIPPPPRTPPRAPAAEIITAAPGTAPITPTRETLLKVINDPNTTPAGLDALLATIPGAK